jgi:hypothetical protein
MITNEQLRDAHKKSRNNKNSIQHDQICGCFYCLNTFDSSKIAAWIDDGQTALCPICGIDAVLSANIAPITKEFLSLMHDRWFKTIKKFDEDEWKRALDKNKLT